MILVTYLFFFCCNLPWVMQLYPSELRTKPFLQPHSYILLWMLKQIWVQGFPSGGHFPENIEIGSLEVDTMIADRNCFCPVEKIYLHYQVAVRKASFTLLLFCQCLHKQKKLMDVWFMNVQVYKSSRETHDWFNETFIQVVG